MGFIEQYIFSNYNYWMSILLMLVGFFIVIDTSNLVKKMVGLGIFQTSVLLLYISVGYVRGAHVPILEEGVEHYVNPLPHVLMLTAIVVGVATLAVGLTIAVRVKEAYGTIEDTEIIAMDQKETEKYIVALKKKDTPSTTAKNAITPKKVTKGTSFQSHIKRKKPSKNDKPKSSRTGEKS